MDIENLTIKQAKEIAKTFGRIGDGDAQSVSGLSDFIGKYCIVRTYSAGVWAGFLEQKYRNEVIIANARRMWRWHCAESISLSAVAEYGIDQKKSKIAVAVASVWLEAIEIIPCTDASYTSINDAQIAEAK